MNFRYLLAYLRTYLLDNYAALLRNFQMLYYDYKFEMILLMIGGLGFNEKVNFYEKEVQNITRKITDYIGLRNCQNRENFQRI